MLVEDVNSQCFPLDKSIRNVNSRLTAMRLQEISIPGTGQEFRAYRSKRIALRVTQTESHLLHMMQSPLLRYQFTRSTSIGLWFALERT